MKVITPGREQKGWSEEFYCTGEGNNGGGCGAKLLVEQGDLFRVRKDSNESGREESTTFKREESITFKCCACGVLTDIKRDFPLYVLYAIHKDQKTWEKSMSLSPNKAVNPDIFMPSRR